MFAFDKVVRTAQPFTNEFDKVRSSFASVLPWGSTSLYDAIAQTAQALSNEIYETTAMACWLASDECSFSTAANLRYIGRADDVLKENPDGRTYTARMRSINGAGDLFELSILGRTGEYVGLHHVYKPLRQGER